LRANAAWSPGHEPPLAPALVVDDHLHMRERLRRILLEGGTPAQQIHCAASLAEARRSLQQVPAQLVLVDIGLPDGSGIELVAERFETHPEIPSLVISAFGAEDVILAALRAGAVGYLLKERDDLEIALSLRSVARGGAPIDPFIARRILGLLNTPADDRAGERPGAPAVSTPLSRREQQVLQLVAEGLSNGEIAETMVLSRLTVESHTRNIYRKLVVGSRTEAVFRARQMGWLP